MYQRSRGPGARVFNFSPGIAFWINNDRTLQANVLNEAGTRVSPRSTETLPLEQWAHVGLAYQVEDDRATVRFFINGREVGVPGSQARYVRQGVIHRVADGCRHSPIASRVIGVSPE
ncbi:MAG: hypothetical protein GEU78_14335 [Actinobacteria bacterium]|nr:hypothetical protein [Actinomycetota bacterium]